MANEDDDEAKDKIRNHRAKADEVQAGFQNEDERKGNEERNEEVTCLGDVWSVVKRTWEETTGGVGQKSGVLVEIRRKAEEVKGCYHQEENKEGIDITISWRKKKTRRTGENGEIHASTNDWNGKGKEDWRREETVVDVEEEAGTREIRETIL